MGTSCRVTMDPQWLKLRWPITALVLGGMATGLLVRSSSHPIQLRLVVSFAEPLNLSGRVQGELSMPKPVRLAVTEQAPIDLRVRNTTPVQVQVSNPDPININVDEGKPMEVDVEPQAPVNVKVGL